MTDLRERKKQRTRDSLVRAAHELFVEKGYEETTVNEIVAAAEVSQRTFFRYFSSKEEVALCLQALVSERYVEAVRRRPPGDSPVEVLRRTLDETWESIGEAIAEVVPLPLYMRMWQISENTPALVAVQLRHAVAVEERLAVEIARRAGLDAHTDPRPRVLVAAFSGVMRAAFRSWSSGADITVAAAQQAVASYVGLLGPALSDDWGSPDGGAGRTARTTPGAACAN